MRASCQKYPWSFLFEGELQLGATARIAILSDLRAMEIHCNFQEGPGCSSIGGSKSRGEVGGWSWPFVRSAASVFIVD